MRRQKREQGQTTVKAGPPRDFLDLKPVFMSPFEVSVSRWNYCRITEPACVPAFRVDKKTEKCHNEPVEFDWPRIPYTS